MEIWLLRCYLRSTAYIIIVDGGLYWPDNGQARGTLDCVFCASHNILVTFENRIGVLAPFATSYLWPREET